MVWAVREGLFGGDGELEKKKIQTRSFLSKLASGPNSPSCNLFGPGSRQYFTIFPANPGRIVVAYSFTYLFVFLIQFSFET